MESSLVRSDWRFLADFWREKARPRPQKAQKDSWKQSQLEALPDEIRILAKENNR